MHVAKESLGLDKVLVVHPGSGGDYRLAEWAEVVSITNLRKSTSEISGG
jgi:hypothetical protein